MRIGYSCWGFLGPGVVDTPDGSRSYRRPFIDGLAAAGHELVLLQSNRDLVEAGLDLAANDSFRSLPNVAVCEFGTSPGPGAHTLQCPVPDELLDRADPAALAGVDRPKPLVYVGNQYDRDEAFDSYFAPAARQFRHRVAGKWPRTGRWPEVNLTGRAPFADVESIHGGAVATVLLLPDRYAAVGHMSSRWFEALLAGCVPITPADIAHAGRFTPAVLHVRDGAEVVERLDWLTGITGSHEHAELITVCLPFLDQSRTTRQVATACKLLENLTRLSR